MRRSSYLALAPPPRKKSGGGPALPKTPPPSGPSPDPVLQVIAEIVERGNAALGEALRVLEETAVEIRRLADG